MKFSLIIAGFGGQGVLSLGKLICYSADSIDKKATFFPSYGGEQRGGTCNCTVVVSDTDISTPIVKNADYIIIMNGPSLDKFKNNVKPGGVLFINESLVKDEIERNDINIIKVKADEIANNFNNPLASNMVILGAFIKETNFVKLDKVEEVIENIMANKKQYLDSNLKALRKGYNQL